MQPVYQAHFGLTREPFNITPDPSFLYLSTSHREALAQLIYGIKARKGFIVLTGEVGTGKTTLIQAVLRELNDNTQTALIYSTIVSPKDLLRYICDDYGLFPYQRDRKNFHYYVGLLNDFLLESYRKGNNCALIIDEAQNLTSEVLESVRLLSNFETSQDKLLQILLVGQPELATRLNSPELRQLKQRVTLRHHLHALSFGECSAYIANRMHIAGGSISVFTPKAIETIYIYSGGVPRLVNILCDNGMLMAYASGKKRVEATMIRETAEDLNLTLPPGVDPLPGKQPSVSPKPIERSSSPNPGAFRRWRELTLLLLVLVLFLGSVLYFWDNRGDVSFLKLGQVSEIIEKFAKEIL